MSDNIEKFNSIVGLIFAELYSQFPAPTEIEPDLFAEKLGFDTTPRKLFDTLGNQLEPEFACSLSLDDFVTEACVWLRDEGFVRGRIESMPTTDLVLTTKSLTILNAKVDALDMSIGSKLKEISKSAAAETRSAAISECVGLALGAAVRTVVGSPA